ncbi:TPA: hypothetical protein ACUNF5_007238 [Burkholderia orbicola]|uniref:hypothetical protein n=1 Tax=Burkholderia orbicola TaxID=2978683 RepID=UPI000F5A2B99|nr:hypothetical protein [Burkholderia orbicola]MDN7535638.1 hypothetical protein [Burkholderia orbicola]
MRIETEDKVLATIVVSTVVLAAAGWIISRYFGAAFAPVLQASMLTIVTISVILYISRRFAPDYLLPVFSGAISVAWFAWWPVLNSIACGGCISDDHYWPFSGESFVNSAWVKLGGEIVFLGISSLLFLRQDLRYYR